MVVDVDSLARRDETVVVNVDSLDDGTVDKVESVVPTGVCVDKIGGAVLVEVDSVECKNDGSVD